MKPIYKSLALTSMTLSVSLSLQGQIYNGESTSESALSSELLDSLRVELVAPNVSGARDLIKSGECTISGSDLSITLNTRGWVKGATYRVQVLATFGTQTQVIYSLSVTVPYYNTLSSEPQEYEDEVVVVSTIGDGDKSGADATVYAKDGDGNAHITKPLSVGGGVASGDGAVAGGNADGVESSSDGAMASGYVNGEGANILSSGNGSMAQGGAYGEGANIQASGGGAMARGSAYGEGANIQASSDGAMASGCVNGKGANIQASSDGAMARGYALGDEVSIQAIGDGSMASGYANMDSGNIEAGGAGSQAFGIGVQATQDAQMVVGKCNVVDKDDTFQFIVGNGEDDEHRSNAFAVQKAGGIALFKADGTPVTLSATQLEALLALLANA